MNLHVFSFFMNSLNRIKLRSVCDLCTASKVKCTGEVPCARCERKGLQCHYRPFRNQKEVAIPAQQAIYLKQPPNSGGGEDLYFFEEYERKTWSVFFSLYKKHMKTSQATCSVVWFNDRLVNMQRFLRSRADPDTLERFDSWIAALGIVIIQPFVPPTPVPSIAPYYAFPSLAEDLIQEATNKGWPLIQLSREGKITTNSWVQQVLSCTTSELQYIVDESGGGFLPFAGDLVARLVCRERDLITYINMMSLIVDAHGRPDFTPISIPLPSSSLVHVRLVEEGKNVPCLLRTVWVQHIDSDWLKTHSCVFAFEIAQPQQKDSSLPASAATVATAASDTTTESLEIEERESKRLELFDQDLLNDSSWIDSLLDEWQDPETLV